MNVKIAHETRDEWLADRKKDITSTDVSALFGVSPYKSYLQLWQQKKHGHDDSIEETERMRAGLYLESGIASWVIDELMREHVHIIGSKVDTYERDEADRMGSSFDWMLMDNAGQNMILEIKNVDAYIFKRNWGVDEDGGIVAPLHIELQLQHQLELTGIDVGYLGVLVGGNSLHIVRRERNRMVGQNIRRKIREFWASIDADNPPAYDYNMDHAYILEMSSNVQAVGECHASEEVESLMAQYLEARRLNKESDETCKALRAQITHMTQDFAKIIGRDWVVDTRLVGVSAGKVVTQDMVGTVVGSRAGYRQFRVTEA